MFSLDYRDWLLWQRSLNLWTIHCNRPEDIFLFHIPGDKYIYLDIKKTRASKWKILRGKRRREFTNHYMKKRYLILSTPFFFVMFLLSKSFFSLLLWVSYILILGMTFKFELWFKYYDYIDYENVLLSNFLGAPMNLLIYAKTKQSSTTCKKIKFQSQYHYWIMSIQHLQSHYI